MGVEFKLVKLGLLIVLIFGFNVQVLDVCGQELLFGEQGVIVIKLLLLLSCLVMIWGDFECFKLGYLSDFFGYYCLGDGGYKDDDGYVFIMGCIDDVINVVGY